MVSLMKRLLAATMVLAVLAPIGGLIAAACSAMPCCAGDEHRITRAMPCCQPVMCANPTPGRQQKAADLPTPAIVVAEQASEIAEETPASPEPHSEPLTSPPRSTAVRLALIATLLI
jgi:hypothetical protein